MGWPSALIAGAMLAGQLGSANAHPGFSIEASRHSTRLARPIAVFGPDQRAPLPANLLPMREKLGVLFNVMQRTVCTAFCVAPSIIGTAAHCLYKTNGEKAPRLADFWFARNYDAVRDYARVAGYRTGASAQSVIAGSSSLSTTPPIAATKDWAFIRLSSSVCSKGVFDMEAIPVEQIIEASKAGRVFQISYHKDYKQWQPAFSKPCAFGRSFENAPWSIIAADFTGPEDLLLHRCGTGGASSGSPLLLDTPQGIKVIGINVGTYVQSRTVLRDERTTERTAGIALANTGVASAAFVGQFSTFRDAHMLGSVSAIRELQERLQKIGHYKGAIDGTYGPTVKLAIEAYEASLNLPATGLASDNILQKLRSTGPIAPGKTH